MESVAIVIPVYNAPALLERCFAALARRRPARSSIVVVDDASSDAAVAPMIEKFARSHADVRVVSSAVNRGYIASANAGARATGGDCDLVFLNSDTEVAQGWFDEMAHALSQRPRAAVCCPLTNNGTFLSVPRHQQDNALPAGWDVDDMAGILRRSAGSGEATDIATPVGFCMLVRRSAWRQWGPFDEAFGAGYGEEDDFGQRVLAGGGEVICAPRAYVHHHGGASFGASAELAERRRANGRLLAARWPGYARRMQEFLARNPLRAVQERLWHALLSAPETRDVHVMHVLPRWEVRGALRDRMLAIARGTRDFANHTIVAPVPEPPHGAWIDVIDHETEPGIRVAGIVDMERRFAQFLQASPAPLVHFHGAQAWERLIEVARAMGRATLVTPEAPEDVARCAAAYRQYGRGVAAMPQEGKS